MLAEGKENWSPAPSTPKQEQHRSRQVLGRVAVRPLKSFVLRVYLLSQKMSFFMRSLVQRLTLPCVITSLRNPCASRRWPPHLAPPFFPSSLLLLDTAHVVARASSVCPHPPHAVVSRNRRILGRMDRVARATGALSSLRGGDGAAKHVSDWSVMKIYLRFLRLIGRSRRGLLVLQENAAQRPTAPRSPAPLGQSLSSAHPADQGGSPNKEGKPDPD
eukprot:1845670-Pyramimonas_sp.AAC.1